MLVAVSDIAIDCRTGAVTVKEKVFDVTPLIVAVMFDVPVPAPIARPLVLIVAIAGEAEFHVTWLVMFAVLASLYVPVAVNCPLVPLAIEPFAALMAIECKIAGVTVTIVLPLADPKVAVTVAVPWATAVTRPSLPIFASEV